MIRLAIKFILFFVILPVSGWGVFSHLDKEGFFNLSQLDFEIDTQQGLTEAYLRPLKKDLEEKLEIYKGQSLARIPLKEIYQKIEDLPWIEKVHLSREWPQTLHLKILPHEVKMIYFNSHGSLIPVLNNAQMLSPISNQEAPDVTLVEGKAFAKSKEVREQALQLLEELPQSGPLRQEEISRVFYEDKEGFGLELIRSGIQVKLGQNHFSIKAARVSQVLEYLDSKSIEARVIDANLSQKVLVRLRKAP